MEPTRAQQSRRASSVVPAASVKHLFSIANGRYLATRLIGEGAFGKVFEGVDTHRLGRPIAMKLERSRTSHPQLEREYKIYAHLSRHMTSPYDSISITNQNNNNNNNSSSGGGASKTTHADPSSGANTNTNTDNYTNAFVNVVSLGRWDSVDGSASFRPIPRIYYFNTGERPEPGNTSGSGGSSYAALGKGSYNIMVMDILGKSLDMLFDDLETERAPAVSHMSLKTIVNVAVQCLTLLEFLHSRSFIHRDIKPDNFVFGHDGAGDEAARLFMIDFGLAKEYRDPRTHQHIPYKEGKSLTGTARYCSINTHLGIEQSRRDDLEAIGYVWLFLLRGSLPWQGLAAKDLNDRYHRIGTVKMSTPVEVLCRGLPPEFAAYVNYTRALDFEEKPNYAYCRRLFEAVAWREGFKRDGALDWQVRALHARMSRECREEQAKRMQRGKGA